MALNRATFFFKDTNQHGWTETIHSQKSDLPSVLTAAKAVVPLRVKCLGQSSRLVYVRVSDDLVVRDSQVYVVPLDDQVPKNPDLGTSDPANTSLVVRLQASSLVRRTLYMRGLPDNIVEDAGHYSPTPLFSANFALWVSQLVSDSWAIKTVDRLIVQHIITSVAQDVVTGRITVTTLDAHGLTLTSGVQIKGAKGAVAINGLHPIYALPSALSFVINSTVIIPAYLGGGLAAIPGYVLAQITQGTPVRIGERKAGRPFDSPVGRRRKARAR
jgi:hypothetical protein